MEFLDAARFFNTVPVTDGYTGAALYLARSQAHTQQDGADAVSKRRTMITEPGTSVPARACVGLEGDTWLVGSTNPDYFAGAEVRRSYDLKKVTDLATLLTPAGACLAGSGPTLYVRREWYHDQVDTLTTSDYDTMWNVFHVGTEGVTKLAFLRRPDGTLMRVRNVYLAQELLNVAECDELEDGPLTATFQTGTKSLVTEQYTNVPVAVQVLKLPVPVGFQYQTQTDSDYRAGDLILLAPQSSVTAKAGQTCTLAGVAYRVQTVAAELDAWLLRMRLA